MDHVAHSAENWREQMEEIIALRSILGSDFKLLGWKGSPEVKGDSDFTELIEEECPEDPTSVRCQVTVVVEVPLEGITLSVVSPHGSQPSEPKADEIRVFHVPPVSLSLEMVPGYPSHQPPGFHLSAFWLSRHQLTQIALALDDMWEAESCCPVCFSWIEWLQRSLLETLQMETHVLLDIQPLSQQQVSDPRVGVCSDDASPREVLHDMIQHDRARAHLEFLKGVWSCPVCLEELPGSSFVRFDECHHFCCRDCFQQYCSVNIHEGNVELHCPEVKCTTPIPPHLLKQHIEQEDFDRWESLLLSRTLETMSDIIYCPRCSTACVVEADNFSQCPKCLYAFCTKCSDSHHPGRDCILPHEKLAEVLQEAEEQKTTRQEHRRYLLDLRNQVLSLEHVKATYQPCPHCGMAIEKNGGCNHMFCTYCQTHYCFKCTARNIDYSHFRSDCNLFEQDVLNAWEQQMNQPPQVIRAAGMGYYRIPKKRTSPLESQETSDVIAGQRQWEEDLQRPTESHTFPESQDVSLEEFVVEGSLAELQDGEKKSAVVCERCFSLRNYGKLKNEVAEALVPQFSVENALKPKIAKNKGKKVVIVCVVDLFDFEGSLPLEELKSLFPASARLPDFLDFIFVGNKVDLIHRSLSKEALEIWVRTRLKEARLPYAKSVHLISSQTMLGTRELMVGLRREVVRNTDCYIIGVQNAGKSSMLNALQRLTRTETSSSPTSIATSSWKGGTTLGFVHVPGFPVPKSCRMFDTPGLHRKSQLTSRLSLEELRLVQPKRMVKPRTYRFGSGNSLLIGGLVRLDLNQVKGQTLYVTVWVSDEIVCFLGKTEKVDIKLEKHRGEMLKPPLQKDSTLESTGELIPQSVMVTGKSWKASSIDICIAGLGWVAVGCEGEAEFTLWTLRDIQVTTRPALLKSYASVFQKPGFSDSVKSRGLQAR